MTELRPLWFSGQSGEIYYSQYSSEGAATECDGWGCHRFCSQSSIPADWWMFSFQKLAVSLKSQIINSNHLTVCTITDFANKREQVQLYAHAGTHVD